MYSWVGLDVLLYSWVGLDVMVYSWVWLDVFVYSWVWLDGLVYCRVRLDWAQLNLHAIKSGLDTKLFHTTLPYKSPLSPSWLYTKVCSFTKLFTKLSSPTQSSVNHPALPETQMVWPHRNTIWHGQDKSTGDQHKKKKWTGLGFGDPDKDLWDEIMNVGDECYNENEHKTVERRKWFYVEFSHQNKAHPWHMCRDSIVWY